MVGRSARQGEKLQAALVERFGQHPHVGDIRGRGLFRGLELVADRETKATFNPKLRVHARLKKAAFEAGLICYPVSGTVDGLNGDVAIIAPPYNATASELTEITDKFATGLRHALTDIKAA